MTEGRGIKKAMRTAATAVMLSILPRPAAACGICVFGMVEYILPHTIFWCLSTAIWFWIVMTIKDWYRFFTASLWIGVAYFIGSAFCGPLPFALLGVMAFAATCKMFRSETWKQLSKAQQIGLKAVSVAAVFCAAAGLTLSMQSKATRSDADFVLQWGNTYTGRSRLQRLIAEKDTGQLRQILSQTKDEYMAGEITEALATIEENRAEQAEDIP